MKAEQVEIPENWSLKQIIDFCYIKGRIGWRGLKKSEFIEEGPYLITGTDFENGGINWKKCYHIPEMRYEESPEIIVKEEDIIVTKDGTIGKIAYIDQLPDRASLNSHLFLVRTNHEVTSKYLFYYLQSKAFRKFIDLEKVGSTRPALTQKRFEEFKILTPKLQEQQAISSILSNVDNIIHQTQQIINHLKLLKKGLMQQLFTQGIGHTEFKETKMGWLPKEWDIVKLEELLEVKSGKRLPKGEKFSAVQTNFPYIRVLDFIDGTINMNNLKYLTPQHKNILHKYTISSEDVYISIAGSIGIVGLVPVSLNNANLTENAASLAIKDKKRLTKEFLYYFLDSYFGQKEIRLRTTITTLPKLAFKRIEKIPIFLPSLKEQNQITSCFKRLDLIRGEEINVLNKLVDIKHGLMQELLTGKKRVLLKT